MADAAAHAGLVEYVAGVPAAPQNTSIAKLAMPAGIAASQNRSLMGQLSRMISRPTKGSTTEPCPPEAHPLPAATESPFVMSSAIFRSGSGLAGGFIGRDEPRIPLTQRVVADTAGAEHVVVGEHDGV